MTEFVQSLTVLTALVMALVWVILPFAIFGIKPLLRDLIEETKRSNDLARAEANIRKATTHTEYWNK